MAANRTPTLKFIASLAIFAVVSIVLLGIGIYSLYQNRYNSKLFGFLLCLLGSALAFAVIRRSRPVFRGRTVFNEIVPLRLPGTVTHEIISPKLLHGGMLVLFFEASVERFAGRITLSKVFPDTISSVFIDLPKIVPYRFNIPSWVPVTEAGNSYTNWPRRTGQSVDPIVLPFSFYVNQKEQLSLKFELESNFKGTRLEARFPINDIENVYVVIKEMRKK